MLHALCSYAFSCLLKSKKELKSDQTISLEIVDNTFTDLIQGHNYGESEEYSLATTNDDEDALNEPFGYSTKKIVFNHKKKNEKEKQMKFIFVNMY